MKVLVINCGSSSLKYQCIDMKKKELLAKGLVERIGINGSILTHQTMGQEKQKIEQAMPDHKIAIQLVIEALQNKEYGALQSIEEISAVGHRVVHGGETFSQSVIITDEVIQKVEECIDLAPLHNPPNLIGIKACQEILPDVPMVAVFDTSFHQTMDESSYLYALPYEYYEKYKIRRYGFHGTSHKYVTRRAAAMLNKEISECNLITCHLGNGASVAAIQNGNVIDTSMGLTPLEGLIMGTRCGDLDPAIVTFIMEKENLTISQINNLMNKQSGVLGMSGVSSDFRDIEQAEAEGNHRAKIALEAYYKRVKKYIGAYYALLGRVDAVVFTAGLGENSAEARNNICSNLQPLGIDIDEKLNDVRGKETNISTTDAKVQVLLIPTNEELMIAEDTVELLQS